MNIWIDRALSALLAVMFAYVLLYVGVAVWLVVATQ